MPERTIKLQKHEVLIIDEELALPKRLGGRAVRALADEHTARDVEVIKAVSYDDGRSVISRTRPSMLSVLSQRILALVLSAVFTGIQGFEEARYISRWPSSWC
jgi:hypothetical protein